MDDRDQRTVFVIGVTGYIGGRLVPRLLEAGYRVRCLARSPKKLDNRSWTDHPAADVFRAVVRIGGKNGWYGVDSDCRQRARRLRGVPLAPPPVGPGELLIVTSPPVTTGGFVGRVIRNRR